MWILNFSVPGCRLPSDVVLIVDSSGSIQAKNFERIKSWLAAFVNELAVDAGQTRVGLVTFGDSEQLRWNLDRYNTRYKKWFVWLYIVTPFNWKPASMGLWDTVICSITMHSFTIIYSVSQRNQPDIFFVILQFIDTTCCQTMAS